MTEGWRFHLLIVTTGKAQNGDYEYPSAVPAGLATEQLSLLPFATRP